MLPEITKTAVSILIERASGNIDNILVMAKSDSVNNHIAGIIYLLKNLEVYDPSYEVMVKANDDNRFPWLFS